MSLSFNTAQGQVMYAPARDFAYCWPAMLFSVTRAFNKEYWKELVRVVARGLSTKLQADGEPSESALEVAWEALCDANDAYACYMLSLCEDPAERVEDVLKRSGFTSCHPAAQVGYMAMLGQVVTGMLYHGVRDVTPADTAKPSCLEDMLKLGHAARRALNGIDAEDEKTTALNNLANSILFALEQAGASRKEIRQVVDSALRAE